MSGEARLAEDEREAIENAWIISPKDGPSGADDPMYLAVEAIIGARLAPMLALAEDFAKRATVYEAHPEYETDRYLDGYATGMRVAEKIARAAAGTPTHHTTKEDA